MKKNFVKIISLGMAAMLSLSISGCGGTADVSTDDATVVTVWTGNGHDKLFMEEKIQEWNSTEGKEKGVKIDYIYQDGNMGEKIELAFKSDSAPDIFGGGSLEKMAKNNQIISYEEIPGCEQIIERFKDYVIPSRHMVEGKTYTIPLACTTYGLIYNKDMFKAAGIVDENGEAAAPETLDELREYAKTLTNESKREYGIAFPGKESWWFELAGRVASASAGHTGYNPQEGLYDLSSHAPVIKMLMGIKKDMSYYPSFESLTNDALRARFAEGGIGMTLLAGSFDVGVLTDQFPAKVEWGVAPFPTVDGTKTYKQNMGAGSGWVINKTSVEKIDNEKLVAVLEFFHSEDLIKEKYKYGYDVPLSMEMVKGVEIDSSVKFADCWKEFCELADISFIPPLEIKRESTGKDGLTKRFLNEIWPNNLSDEDIDRIVKECQDDYNEGIRLYQEHNPDFDPSVHIVKDWDTKR